MYCVQKHVETGPNYSYELAIFLKYHMLLNKAFLACLIEPVDYIPTDECVKRLYVRCSFKYRKY